jgi:hypothetical protein
LKTLGKVFNVKPSGESFNEILYWSYRVKYLIGF